MIKLIGFFCTIIALTCCSSSKQATNDAMLQYGKEAQITDSVMQSLQQKNSLVLAYVSENNAWVKSKSYQVIAKDMDGNWMGYFYYVNNTPGIPRDGSSFNINPAVVSNNTCDSIWAFFQQQQVWKIKGDEGKNFCSTSNSNCTVNDGQTMRLLILTKTKMIDAAYYEPEFYEGCCPGNADRKLFIEAGQKIQAVIQVHGSK